MVGIGRVKDAHDNVDTIQVQRQGGRAHSVWQVFCRLWQAHIASIRHFVL